MRGLFTAAVLLVAAIGVGCTPTYVQEDRTDRRERVLTTDKHIGGTHHRTLVVGELWYQSFANQLLVLSTEDGRTISEVDVQPWGEGGPVVDMALDGTTLWAVTDRSALVELDVSDPVKPVVRSTIPADELGIEPRLVSLAGGEVWVSGDGGVVRVRDGKRFLTGEPVSRVVQTPAGPAATVRRRIVMLEDSRYLGAATELHPLPPGFGPDGGYLFALQGQGSAQAGIMTPAFSEVSSVAIAGNLRRVRIVGDRMVLVTDTELEFWRLRGGKLVEPTRVPLKGPRDLDLIKPNHYAIGGTFGRSMYRFEREGTSDGDTFYNVHREPGLLEQAVTDRRRILAGGREGFWLWRIGGEVELTDKTTDITSIMPRSLDAAWGSATLITEGPKEAQQSREVEFRHDGTTTRYSADGAPRITALALVDGDVWIGHERGVDVVRRMPAGAAAPAKQPASVGSASSAPAPFAMRALHQFRFEGPVLFIFPERLGGGAAIVSLHGGFALLKPTPIGEAPTFKGRGDVR